jgi:hypothetical protein
MRTDVSEERTTFIFGVENHMTMKLARSRWLATKKMEVIRSSETSVNIRTTRRSVSEDGNILKLSNQENADRNIRTSISILRAMLSCSIAEMVGSVSARTVKCVRAAHAFPSRSFVMAKTVMLHWPDSRCRVLLNCYYL